MQKQIEQLSNDYYNELLDIFHHLHSHPELSFQEEKTSEFICNKLDKYGIAYKKYAQTGIVGIIKGGKDGRNIGLRADMDALPINENPTNPYCSVNEGVMHACGHDIHMTCLLGAAKILQTIKESVCGNILLIFQPGEEKLPGGAKQMIEEGAFDDIKPDWIGALHCDPSLPVGSAGFRKGMYMASGDEIFIDVKGKGGHAALPHKTSDTILIASHIIVALQQIVSRHCPPSIPCVLTFGKITGNGAVNIIPKEVNIEGTFRTMNEEWRSRAKKLIREISISLAESMGAECKVNIIDGYPYLENDPQYTEESIRLAEHYLGKENTHELEIRMTTEDFGYYSQKFRTSFFRLGVKDNTQREFALHTPEFIAGERSINYGSGLLAWIAYNLCCTSYLK